MLARQRPTPSAHVILCLGCVHEGRAQPEYAWGLTREAAVRAASEAHWTPRELRPGRWHWLCPDHRFFDWTQAVYP